jgi:hypothetical protein
MEEKLRRLMKHEGINSTRLAEILGIQASGISHIMSGRNKPSYDFLLKLLQRFPQINPDWLLLDKGPMYRDEIKNKSNPSAFSGSGGPGRSVVPNASETIGVTPAVRNSFGSAGTADLDFGVNTGSGTVKDVNSGAGMPSGGTFHNNTGNITGNSGLFANQPRATGRALEPDNEDIIPSIPGRQQAHANRLASDVHTVGSPAGFARSGAIERIVVFYKDKTFSEYQPE